MDIMKMRTISIAITIALTAFSIIGQVKPKIEVRTVNFCELKSSPDKFAEKIIQSNALYTASLETVWLSQSSKCKNGEIVFDVEFDKEWRENSSAKSVAKFEKKLKIKNGKIGERRTTKVNFGGMLDVIKSAEKDKPYSYKIKILFLK